jgi:hypothetical protein
MLELPTRRGGLLLAVMLTATVMNNIDVRD